MNEGLIPRRYAKALYGFASEKKCSGRVYELMKNLSDAFETLPELQHTVANPFVSDADKTALLSTAAQAGSEDAVFGDFMKLLAHNRRLEMARQIALAYLDIYRAANRIYVVKVASASPLGKEEEQRLRALVARHVGGASIEFSTEVDPGLIGGFTINVGNEKLDASISNELKQLRQNLISK